MPLGDINGSGFGFGNINAYHFGVQYVAINHLTLRAGFEMTDQFLTLSNTAFIVLVPTTMNRTYTVGATYRIGAF